eukprot:1159061-Pelagomonas_calceolata.AAC.5
MLTSHRSGAHLQVTSITQNAHLSRHYVAYTRSTQLNDNSPLKILTCHRSGSTSRAAPPHSLQPRWEAAAAAAVAAAAPWQLHLPPYPPPLTPPFCPPQPPSCAHALPHHLPCPSSKSPCHLNPCPALHLLGAGCCPAVPLLLHQSISAEAGCAPALTALCFLCGHRHRLCHRLIARLLLRVVPHGEEARKG